VGRRVARMLSSHGIDVVMIDFDQRRVEAARERGYPVVFGDAARGPVLHAVGIERARLALITVPAAVDSMAVARRIRELAPALPLFVRTDTLEEVDDLIALGAVHVVQPEFEAALEMGREAMEALDVSPDVITTCLAGERSERFGPELAS